MKCPGCKSDDPGSVTIEVRLNPSALTNHSTEIHVYSGNLEDNVLLGTYTTFAEKWYHTVPVNKKYTISATYYYSGNFYKAFGSVIPRVRYEDKLCGSPCYITYDDYLDLRIRYW